MYSACTFAAGDIEPNRSVNRDFVKNVDIISSATSGHSVVLTLSTGCNTRVNSSTSTDNEGNFTTPFYVLFVDPPSLHDGGSVMPRYARFTLSRMGYLV